MCSICGYGIILSLLYFFRSKFAKARCHPIAFVCVPYIQNVLSYAKLIIDIICTCDFSEDEKGKIQ